MVDYAFTLEERQFRQDLRQLISAEMPENYPGIFVDEDWPVEASHAFCRTLGERGLLTRAWPPEYGGQDASLWSQVVFNEEMWSHNEPRGGQYMGVTWIGPALMAYGTPEQRDRHLPAISQGEVQWCQGFSEPDAGSDLASLRTRATPSGEGEWRVNGQKIWTSYALLAQWCVLAARTSVEETKHAGLTVFLVPMDREGITVRPIPTMLGPHHFHEVFFDDVQVTHDDVLGEVGNGWEVMTAGLAYERVGIPRYARADRILAQVRSIAGDDDVSRPQMARVMTRALMARLMNYRVIADRIEGQGTRGDGAAARIASIQLEQEVNDVAMDILGTEALRPQGPDDPPALGDMEHHWRYAQAATVAAGALEIQKGTVGRELLGPPTR